MAGDIHGAEALVQPIKKGRHSLDFCACITKLGMSLRFGPKTSFNLTPAVWVFRAMLKSFTCVAVAKHNV